MFEKLIPWKRQRGGELKVRHENDPVARLREDMGGLWNRFVHPAKGRAAGPDRRPLRQRRARAALA